MGKILSKKPLAEAILEFRWGRQTSPDQLVDPNYQILFGRLYDYFMGDGYTYHEALPASEMPPIMTAHQVQQRFRVGKDKWPLVQIGQGVLTLNDVENYDWDNDYSKRAIRAISGIYEKYPGDFDDVPKQFVSLKYIDAYHFDFDNNDLSKFLKEKMSLEISLPEKLLMEAGSTGNPKMFTSDFIYEIPNPKGEIKFKIGRGVQQPGNSSILIWETEVRSIGADVPQRRDALSTWLDEAHTVTSKWFFGLIEGELEKEFE